MDNAVLRITDGIDYVDLVGQNSAFQVKEWTPVMANPKGGMINPSPQPQFAMLSSTGLSLGARGS